MLHIDDAYKPILDREAAAEMAGKFSDAIELLLELVDYGTKLIPRAYDSSDHGLKAICLVFVQLRQFISHLDGITTLLRDGDCATANLQLRSLLETAHLMEWILSTDTDEKIKHLYVANLRRRRHWDRIIIPGTTEATNHAAVASLLKLEPQQIQGIKDEVTRIDSLLGQPEFSAINAKFEVFYSKHGFDKPWYDIYGVSSIRKVSEEINKLGEYKYIYSSLSGVTHGSDMWRSVFFDKDHVKVSPIREPQHIPQVARLASTWVLRVYLMILKQFRAGEEENFARKYNTDWRERFLRKYDVRVMSKETTI